MKQDLNKNIEKLEQKFHGRNLKYVAQITAYFSGIYKSY